MGIHDDLGNNIMSLPIKQNIIEALKKKKVLEEERDYKNSLLANAFKKENKNGSET